MPSTRNTPNRKKSRRSSVTMTPSSPAKRGKGTPKAEKKSKKGDDTRSIKSERSGGQNEDKLVVHAEDECLETTRATKIRGTPKRSSKTKKRSTKNDSVVLEPKSRGVDIPEKDSIMKLVFSSDDSSEEIVDLNSLRHKKIHQSESSADEKDEALSMLGKYGGAKAIMEKRRGDLKGSEVYGFKTPAAKKQTRVVRYNAKRGAVAYFDAQISNADTSDATLSKLKRPQLSQEDMDKLLKDVPMRFQGRIDVLLQDYRNKFDKWLDLLQDNFSVILFGYGSKKRLLQEFLASKLSDQDSIVVNGFFPSLTIKQILNLITEDILEEEGVTFQGINEHLAFIKDAMDDRIEHLYLIVNNIDGQMLRNEKSQTILAQLSAHPKVHLICSIDHINAPLIWDHHKLSKFNFVWFDTTTYLPYRDETRFENSFMITQTGALELNSLISVFATLNQNARTIYLKIVRYQMEAMAENDDISNYEGMAFSELYQKCRADFLVNSDLTLHAQLTEFKDHNLITIKKGTDRSDYLTIPLKKNALLEFQEMQDD